MITFVYPNCTGQRSVQLGIAYLSSILIQAGYKTSLIDTTWTDIGNITEVRNVVKNVILKENPFLVAISCRSLEFDLAIKISKIIKGLIEVPIVFGGPHPTINPQEVISINSVDYVCLGEGEYALLELANKLSDSGDISSIKNLWVKEDGKIIKNEIRPLIEDLDSLPFPESNLFDDRHMLLDEPHITTPIKVGHVQIGRGCPNYCPYCINHFFRKLYKDKGCFVRFRSPENVIDELRELKKKYSVQFIYFTDDTFAYNKKLTRKFLKLYKKEINVPFTCLTRADTINKNLAFLLRDAGCRQVGIGVESGEKTLRDKLLRRKESNSTIIEAFRLLNEANIWTHAFNMLGLPFETENSILKTINLNKNAGVDAIQLPFYYPFEGTDLREFCISKKIFDPEVERCQRLTNYYQGSILKFPDDFQRKLLAYKLALSNYYRIFFQLPLRTYPLLVKIFTKPIFPVTIILDRCRLRTEFDRVIKIYGIRRTRQHIINLIICELFTLFLRILLFPFSSKKI